MKNSDLVFKFIKDTNKKQYKAKEEIGCTTEYIAKNTNISRANVSSILNKLHKIGQLQKSNTRPVVYYINETSEIESHISLDSFFTNIKNSHLVLPRAKAAMSYSPHGLNSCLIGEVGVGKSLFAKLMHNYGCEEGVLPKDAPYYTIDCTAYHYNDKELLKYLFGLNNGEIDSDALVFKIDAGVLLFKDPHLLLKQTQELILYFINNMYLPNHKKEFSKVSNIIFICSCSGQKNNFAIQQFSSNFPIIIELPSLKHRSFSDRLEYIEIFFQLESDRLNKKIVVDVETMECFLLYNCLENFVQLKRDIRNACEYVQYHTTTQDTLHIGANSIRNRVKQGLYNYKKHQDEIIDTLDGKEEFVFNVGENKDFTNQFLAYNNSKHYNISHVSTAHKRKMKIVNDYRDVELSKIFSSKNLQVAKAIFNNASDKLDISYDKKSFFSLCMYLETSNTEKKQQESVYNADSIKKQNYKEYQVVIDMKEKLAKEYMFELTESNAVHISTFLNNGNDIYTYKNLVPPIIVLMHGVSVASSFVETVTQFMYIENIHAYDIHLNKPQATVYRELKELITSTNYSQGVLILSDISTLKNICSAIAEELHVKISILDKVHMRLALESAFYLDHYRDIDYVFNKLTSTDSNETTISNTQRKNLIVVASTQGSEVCTTTADYIIDNIDCTTLNIDCISLDVYNQDQIKNEIEKLKISNNILLISNIDYNIKGIEFLSLTDIYIYNSLVNIIKFAKKNINNNEKHQHKYDIYQSVIQNFKNLDVPYDVDLFNHIIMHFLEELEIIYNIVIPCDIGIGIISHISATLSQLINGTYDGQFKMVSETTLNKIKFQQIRCLFYPLEEAFDVLFSDDEIYIIEYTLANYRPSE